MQVLVTGNEDGELEHAKSVRHLLPRPQIGSVQLVIWLVIGGIAAGQRGDYKRPADCSSFSTAAVTILAGALNYAHVDPHINCTTPHPSS
jgi:hypothetical protein